MLAVYDTMRFVRSDIATFCVGQAVAVGAVLLAAGTRGKRAALTHARVILHQFAAQGRGAIPDLILQADEVVRVRGDLERILVDHTSQSTSRSAHSRTSGRTPRAARGSTAAPPLSHSTAA